MYDLLHSTRCSIIFRALTDPTTLKGSAQNPKIGRKENPNVMVMVTVLSRTYVYATVFCFFACAVAKGSRRHEVNQKEVSFFAGGIEKE